MSTNPYELRAGLLGQAQGILDHNYHAEMDRLRFLCEKAGLDASTVSWPTPPKTEDILAEAEKLYKFVQTK